MKEPIIEFRDIEQAYDCLREWQERLFLTDWIIKIILETEPIIDDGERQAWQIEYNTATRCAKIYLTPHNDDTASRIKKISHEKTLVHELCHLKLDFACAPHTLEQAWFAKVEHTLIEQFAMSLIMAKYGIGFDWFKNF